MKDKGKRAAESLLRMSFSRLAEQDENWVLDCSQPCPGQQDKPRG